MSENASGEAENQQGSRLLEKEIDPSETTRRAPFSRRVIIAYFLGAIHDGTFSQNRRSRISQKGTDWLLVLKDLLKNIGHNAWIYQEGKNRDVYVLETIAGFLDFYFDPLQLQTKEENIAYIRGFFDAEGGIPRKKTDPFYIQLVQDDKKKLQKLKKILENLRIRTGKIHNPSWRVDPNYWRMYILSESHKRFVQKLGTWHPRKIRTLQERMMI